MRIAGTTLTLFRLHTPHRCYLTQTWPTNVMPSSSAKSLKLWAKVGDFWSPKNAPKPTSLGPLSRTPLGSLQRSPSLQMVGRGLKFPSSMTPPLSRPSSLRPCSSERSPLLLCIPFNHNHRPGQNCLLGDPVITWPRDPVPVLQLRPLKDCHYRRLEESFHTSLDTSCIPLNDCL